MDIQRIHAYDFNTAASYANAGENGVGSYSNGKGLYPYNGTSNGNLGEEFQYDQVSYEDYAEGIYVGYKWYETADAEGYWNQVENDHGKGYEGLYSIRLDMVFLIQLLTGS